VHSLAVCQRLRLEVTLSDVLQCCEVWAERFDRFVDDIFELQDEIGDLIVAAVEREIEQAERRRALPRPLASLDAWSAYHCACWHLYRYRAEDCDHAARFLDIALRLDPDSPRVHAGLSFLHWQRAFLEITQDRDDAITRSLDHARHSVSLDPLDPLGHWALGRAARLDEDIEHSVEEHATAVELNPSFANAHYSLGSGLKFLSRFAEAIASVQQARRISPYDPMTFSYLSLLAELNALEGDHDRAVAWAKRAARQPNAHYHILAIAAWCHELAGQRDEAKGYIARLRAQHPGYCRKDFFRAFPFRAKSHAAIEGALAALGL
jgi:tetratricopeptide (TPR) repeat protein